MTHTKDLNAVIISFMFCKDIKMLKDRGRGNIIWMIDYSSDIVEVLKLNCSCIERNQFLVCIMEASLESIRSSILAFHADADFKELKGVFEVLQI